MKSSIFKHCVIQFVSLAVLLAAVSCQKSQEEVVPQQAEEVNVLYSSARVSAGTTYTTTPSLNAYTNCGNVVVSSGTCGTYVGGNIRAKVIKANGSQFVIRLERCNNQQLFGGVGMAYIMGTNFCGTQWGKAEIKANFWYIDITVNATFTTGYFDLVPVVVLPGQKVRWFGQPIRVTANTIASPNFPITTMKNSSNTSSGNIYCIAPKNVFAPTNIGQCTWYVYGRIQELVAGGYISQSSGNILDNAFRGKYGRDAFKWPTFIGGIWVTTSAKTPLESSKRKKGMIVIWDEVTYQGSKTGHVGFVEEISTDGTKFRVSEFNITPKKYTAPEKWFSFSQPRNITGTPCYPKFYQLDVLK